MINAHEIFRGCSIKEIWQHCKTQEAHRDTMRNCISNHLYVLQWGEKKISSAGLLTTLLEYFNNKLLKFTFFLIHFPLSPLCLILLQIIIFYISQNSTRQPPENRRELVASSWVTYTVCVGRGSNNNRDSRSQRAEFFHSRKNESHSYSKHSEPCGALSMGISATSVLYISVCNCW